MDFTGKTYVVTGATSGIGLAAAELLVQAGANVIGVGRSAERCQQSVQRLARLNPGAAVHYLTADLAVQAEVRRLAGQIESLLAAQGKTALDGLVNNAGLYTFWLALTPDGVETQWAVNHLAGFLLARLLLPLLQAAPRARVVTVSSASHYGARIHWDDPQQRRNYNGLRAYGVTKLANVLFTQGFNRQYAGGSGVRAFALDPGLVKTDIAMKGTPALVNWFWKLRRMGGTPPEVPARAILYLLGEPSIQDAQAVYWKDGQPKRPSRAALDGPSADKLWRLSEKMCGLS